MISKIIGGRLSHIIKWTALIMLFMPSYILGQIPPGDSKINPVTFFKEFITVSLSDSEANIEGIYYFRNNQSSGQLFRVFFPFYLDSLTLFPHEIAAFKKNGKHLDKLAYMATHNAVRFSVPLNADTVTVWSLQYSQNLRSKSAIYILKSAQTWRKPLEEAHFMVNVPRNFKNVKIWPEPDSSRVDAGRVYYFCTERNFMPERDLEINWE